MPRKAKPPGDYAVGYGRPPEHSRFKPGRSGNPKGRPKGARDFATELLAELQQKVRVVENGRPKTRTKQQLLITTNVNKAIKGDARALREILAFAYRSGAADAALGAAQLASETPFTAAEQAVIDRFFAPLPQGSEGPRQETIEHEPFDEDHNA